jgi:2-polyprenyl-6-hydroxyphenyl methylase/3-demethylubiquinone-9 3-methyltransferase
MSDARTATSVDRDEVRRFDALAQRWWDPGGEMAPLHRLGPVRIGFVSEHLARLFGRDARSLKPFQGLRLLDIGCGGGLMAEPMARLGFEVVAIDAAAEPIEVARAHALAGGLSIDYRVATAESLAAAGERFDAVLALEVIEHVADRGLFLAAAAALVRPGGGLVAATINRTAKSFLLAIVGAEYLLRWLPVGTHEWRKLVRPSELVPPLRRAGLVVEALAGVAYDPVAGEWRLAARDLDVNYMLFARRPGAASTPRPGGESALAAGSAPVRQKPA